MNTTVSKRNNFKKQGKSQLGEISKPGGAVVFWRRPGNVDLDRAGDLLLKGLEDIRKESRSRGASR